jgi:hypothetical protein
VTKIGGKPKLLKRMNFEEPSRTSLATLRLTNLKQQLSAKSKEFTEQQHQLIEFLSGIELEVKQSKAVLEEERRLAEERRREYEKYLEKLKEKESELEKEKQLLWKKTQDLHQREKILKQRVVLSLFLTISGNRTTGKIGKNPRFAQTIP